MSMRNQRARRITPEKSKRCGNMSKRVTGVMINYYFICHRKLWLFVNNIQLEGESEDVGIGKLIDETSYSRDKKSIMIDELINLDFIRSWKVIHEVKKSKKLDEAAKWQVRYYLYILRGKGVDVEKGIIDYPLIKRREEVVLDLENEKELVAILEDIESIINRKQAPETIKKPFCKKCAYYEFCYI